MTTVNLKNCYQCGRVLDINHRKCPTCGGKRPDADKGYYPAGDPEKGRAFFRMMYTEPSQKTIDTLSVDQNFFPQSPETLCELAGLCFF